MTWPYLIEPHHTCSELTLAVCHVIHLFWSFRTRCSRRMSGNISHVLFSERIRGSSFVHTEAQEWSLEGLPRSIATPHTDDSVIFV